MEKGPIFITGFGRSGTTLLGNIIDRHPNIAVFVESFFIPKYYFFQIFFWPLRKSHNFIKLSRIIVNEDASKANNLQMNPRLLLKVKTRTYSSLIDTLMRDWAKDQGKGRWGDKSPGYISRLSLLHKLFPDAKFVHIIRDVRDVWLSRKKLGVGTSIINFTRDWEHTICKARKYAEVCLKENYLELRYEDLISDSRKEIKRVMSFLGETYSDELLLPERTVQRNKAFKNWPKINQIIDVTNYNKWRNELSENQIVLFETLAGHLLSELGYPLVSNSIPNNKLYPKYFVQIFYFYIERYYRMIMRRTKIFMKYCKQIVCN